METTIEWCPNCSDEVELKAKMVVQVCPTCKEKILPCSICDTGYTKCNECPLE